MKKSFFNLSLIACLLFSAAKGFSASPQALELKEPGKLYVATTGKFPPFSFMDKKGNLEGLEVKLMQEVCRRLDLIYMPVLTTWESLLVGLMADNYDITTESMDITPERQKKVDFVPWLKSGGVIVVLNNSPIQHSKDLAGKTIGTLVASTWGHLLKEANVLDIKYYKTETLALIDLTEGRTEAVVTDALNAAYFQKASGKPIRILSPTLTEVTKGWALKKNKPNLYHMIKTTLENMITDGTYLKIVKEYVDYDTTPTELGDLKKKDE